MFPYEVVDKGLKKYTGNTVNAHTKKNKQLSEKFRVRTEKQKVKE